MDILFMEMEYEQHFPLGIALGKHFIGRRTETNWLIKNIEHKVHSLLLAPTGYGKTSLVINTLKQNNYNYFELNLTLCQTAAAVEQFIISNIESFLKKHFPNKETIILFAKEFFKKNNKLWTVELINHIEIRIRPQHHDNIADNIITLLELLELLLKQENQQLIIFLDDVQALINLSDNNIIQQSINYFTKKSDNIIFIFSGTNLGEFNTIQAVSEKITLYPIDSDSYKHYFAKELTLTENFSIDAIISKIYTLTDGYPSYSNHLFLTIWRMLVEKSTQDMIQAIDNAWKNLVNTAGKPIRALMTELTSNQLELLCYLVDQSDDIHFTQLRQAFEQLSQLELIQVLSNLETKNLIVLNTKNHYQITDPVIKQVLQQLK